MMIRIKPSALKQTKPRDYLVRFALGGFATLGAGLIADRFGPATGGLFLAFPAIFCASSTLIEKHERERKTKKGLNGSERGRGAAALDAAGAGWGSLALVTFAATVYLAADRGALLSLTLASLNWLVLATAFWFVRRKLRP